MDVLLVVGFFVYFLHAVDYFAGRDCGTLGSMCQPLAAEVQALVF